MRLTLCGEMQRSARGRGPLAATLSVAKREFRLLLYTIILLNIMLTVLCFNLWMWSLLNHYSCFHHRCCCTYFPYLHCLTITSIRILLLSFYVVIYCSRSPICFVGVSIVSRWALNERSSFLNHDILNHWFIDDHRSTTENFKSHFQNTLGFQCLGNSRIEIVC